MKTMIKVGRPYPQPQTGADALQPLREVGSLEKTQHWHQDDIMAALRAARLRGIAPERLFSQAKKGR